MLALFKLSTARVCVALVVIGFCSGALGQHSGAQAPIETKGHCKKGSGLSGCSTNDEKNTSDWVAQSDLTPEQQATSPRSCNGAYIEPLLPDSEANIAPRYAEIKAEADRSQIHMESGEAILEGDVIFTQGWRKLSADRVVVNQQQNNYQLEGNVSIREPGLLVTGDSAHVLGENSNLNVVNADYLLHEQGLRGSADKISRNSDGKFSIENATYTSCEPDSNAWLMQTSELNINEKTGRVSGRDVVIRTAGIPVLYIPYISFPYDDRRQSGLLYPSIKNSSDDGLDYTQPIYWNIQPNQDVTFTPRLIEQRGVLLGTEHRLLSASTNTESSLNYSPQDTSGDRNDLYGDTPRWLLDLNHQGYIKNFWTAWDITRVSDIDYFEDYGESVIDDASASTLSQFGAVGYQNERWSVSVLAETFQSLVVGASNQYRRLPELDTTRWANILYTF